MPGRGAQLVLGQPCGSIAKIRNLYRKRINTADRQKLPHHIRPQSQGNNRIQHGRSRGIMACNKAPRPVRSLRIIKRRSRHTTVPVQLGYGKISRRNDHTVMTQLDKIRPGQLQIAIDCGTGDFFYEVNEKLHRELLYRNIPHDYTVRPGAHNHPYWNNAIDFQTLFFSKFFASQAAKK